MKKVLSLFIMLTVGICYATPKEDPKHALDRSELHGPYDSMVEAATYGIEASYKLTNHYESGGIIFEDTKTHRFYDTNLTTDVAIDHVHLDHDVFVEGHPEYKIVSDWHVHPCMPYTHIPTEFSGPDIHSYQVYHEVGFMGEFCTGAIHRWDAKKHLTTIVESGDPGDPKPHGLMVADPVGDIVGKISIDQKPVIQENFLDVLRYINGEHDGSSQANHGTLVKPTKK